MKANIRKQRWLKRLSLTLLIALLVIGTGVVVVRRVYNVNLKPLSANQSSVTVNIPLGSSLAEIATILKDQKLIKSEWAFKQYVRNKGADSDIKAGVYELSPSYSVPEIVSIITEGKIKTNLVTILPGQTIKQIKQTLISHGFSGKSVELALQPNQYKGHPALVDKPEKADLEGYLYPESYQKTETTKPEEIVRLALDEMGERLTPSIRASIANQKISIYKGLIIASIAEKEANTQAERAQVVQVVLTRLTKGMRLEVDPTAYYGADKDGKPRSLRYDSPYNTYLHEGLPPGPISNISQESLAAVAAPAKTNWIYFVAGDDGNTYFSKTLEQHRQLIRQHCKKLCAAP